MSQFHKNKKLDSAKVNRSLVADVVETMDKTTYAFIVAPLSFLVSLDFDPDLVHDLSRKENTM